MGSVLRVAVRLREPLWSTGRLRAPDGGSLARLSFLHADAPIPVWWTPAPVVEPLLIGWCGGPRARELAARDAAAVHRLARDVLAEHLCLPPRELDREIVSCSWHDWDGDPYARGAYSYVPVNGLSAQRSLAEPVADTLFLAGEATSVNDPGTVHGALESGSQVGRRVCEVLASGT